LGGKIAGFATSKQNNGVDDFYNDAPRIRGIRQMAGKLSVK